MNQVEKAPFGIWTSAFSEETCNLIIEAGKHPGTLVADADQAKYWNDKGINFLIGSANRYLMNGAKEFIETTKKILRS